MKTAATLAALALDAPRAAGEAARSALLALLCTVLDRLFSRLESLFEQWRAGTLPPPASPRTNSPAKAALRARRANKKESSFCEQKEAKKLPSFDRDQHRAPMAAARTPSGGAPPLPQAMDEVFLLLFVHKKKTLPALPRFFTPTRAAPTCVEIVPLSK